MEIMLQKFVAIIAGYSDCFPRCSPFTSQVIDLRTGSILLSPGDNFEILCSFETMLITTVGHE